MHLTKRERALLGTRMTATQRVSLARIHGPLKRRPSKPVTIRAASEKQRAQRVIDSHLVEHEVDQTGKGLFKGKCNRTACDHRGEGIVWWNRSTRAYYCADCKYAIDSWIDRDYGPCFHKHPHTADGVPHTDDQNESVA
jgi:hypothetical protein